MTWTTRCFPPSSFSELAFPQLCRVSTRDKDACVCAYNVQRRSASLPNRCALALDPQLQTPPPPHLRSVVPHQRLMYIYRLPSTESDCTDISFRASHHTLQRDPSFPKLIPLSLKLICTSRPLSCCVPICREIAKLVLLTECSVVRGPSLPYFALPPSYSLSPDHYPDPPKCTTPYYRAKTRRYSLLHPT